METYIKMTKTWAELSYCTGKKVFRQKKKVGALIASGGSTR